MQVKESAMEETIIVKYGNTLHVAGKSYPCVVGKGGISDEKREGDGATPRGLYPLRQVLYRADRTEAPITGLQVSVITKEDGWCDDPASPSYNERVFLPFEGSHEKLWRDDHAYDMLVVIGYNDKPVVPGKGSAIFLHLMHEDQRPTEGCVAVSANHMRELLMQLTPGSQIHIE